MRIVITNDDGIQAKGLEILASWARKLGDVTVVAPKVNQSATSHAINIRTPFEVKKVQYSVSGVEAYSVDSTPADCTRVALYGLDLEPDLVLSGINRGLNLGEDIAYSGTDGAVFEASYAKKNAIAFSTDQTSFDGATEECLDRIWSYFVENRLLEHYNLYNVNIPLVPGKILITQQGGAYFRDTYIQTEPDMYMAQGYSMYKDGKNLEMDLDATMNGYISISPLTTCRTRLDVYARLKGLNENLKADFR